MNALTASPVLDARFSGYEDSYLLAKAYRELDAQKDSPLFIEIVKRFNAHLDDLPPVKELLYERNYSVIEDADAVARHNEDLLDWLGHFDLLIEQYGKDPERYSKKRFQAFFTELLRWYADQPLQSTTR